MTVQQKRQRFYWLLNQLNSNGNLDDITRGNYHVEADKLEKYAFAV